jgi:hypothetical protein
MGETSSTSTSSTTPVSSSPAEPNPEKQDYQKEAEFIKKVSERVWQLLQQDLRHDQERRGKRFGRR